MLHDGSASGRRLIGTGRVVAGLTCALLMVPGCGPAAGGRLKLSGEVTLRGEPLEKGTIEFASLDASRQTGTGIAKGRFAVPVTKGLLPGTYKVRITAVQESAGPPSGPPGPEAAMYEVKDLIPPEYNAKTTLTVDVKNGEANHFTFDLK